MKKIRKFIAWSFLLFFILMGSGVTEGFVLCFGSDGHTAVEPSHSGLPGSSSNWPLQSASPVSSLPGAFSDGKHDISCTDIPISIASLDDSLTFYKNQGELSFTFNVSIISGLIEPQDDKLEEKSFRFLPSTINTSLNSLRTIILLV